MLYAEVMYHFNEQVDLKISSKLIQASMGYIYKQMLTLVLQSSIKFNNVVNLR